MKQKKRLDIAVQEQYPNYSRQQIQSFIMQGHVFVDDQKIEKPGHQVKEDQEIILKVDEPKYVSRAGYKLEKALEQFNIDPTGLICLDAGLSTGGFTDCLLQSGAQKVYGIDVGYGQVHEKIREHPQVILKERTNLRNLTFDDIGEQIDIVTLDLSFISILKVMDAINSVLKSGGTLITLIKPQFEAERHEVGTKGVIKDPKIHEKVIQKIISGIEAKGYKLQESVIESPIQGATGNKEFLAYFRHI